MFIWCTCWKPEKETERAYVLFFYTCKRILGIILPLYFFKSWPLDFRRWPTRIRIIDVNSRSLNIIFFWKKNRIANVLKNPKKENDLTSKNRRITGKKVVIGERRRGKDFLPFLKGEESILTSESNFLEKKARPEKSRSWPFSSKFSTKFSPILKCRLITICCGRKSCSCSMIQAAADATKLENRQNRSSWKVDKYREGGEEKRVVLLLLCVLSTLFRWFHQKRNARRG